MLTNQLPAHGQLTCTRCFSEGQTLQRIGKWKMRNDPGAWGSSSPSILVLGFSKGATQAQIYTQQPFDDVAFGGKETRKNLTAILQRVQLLKPTETVDEKIKAEEREFHFGSLVRCSLARHDAKASRAAGHDIFKTSGELILKSFTEVPQFIANCTDQYLRFLPSSVKLILVLGVTDGYVRQVRTRMQALHPVGFHIINSIAYANQQCLWVHLTHPSRGNGTLHAWLTATALANQSAAKRDLAIEVLQKHKLTRV